MTTFFNYNGFHIDTFDMDDVDLVQDYFRERFESEVVTEDNKDDCILLNEAWSNWLDVLIEDGALSREIGETLERVDD